MGMDVRPFSFGTEKIKIRMRDKIVVEVLCLKQMSIFHQIGFIRMLPEKVNGILWFGIKGCTGSIIGQGMQQFKTEQMPSVLFEMDEFSVFFGNGCGK